MANWDVIKGKWKQISGDARAHFGALTGDDWEMIGGNKDRLLGKLQERYGWTKEDAQRNADEFFARWDREGHA
jgi:uncharacterized protein YjbJ (UPF0337 family)